MNGRPGPAALCFGRGAPRKKDHTPAQPVVCEGAYDEKTQETGYIKSLQTNFFCLFCHACGRCEPPPARRRGIDRGEGFEREGERHMNGKGEDYPGARERRRVSGGAGEGAVPQGRPHRNHMRSC